MTDSERQAWLAERRTGIGATDSAAILGLSPWRTALEVYLDKTGQLPDRLPTPAMRWGLLLEDAIAQAYTEDTGRRLDKPDVPIWRHPDHDWMICTVDRHTLDSGRLVELKTASSYAASEWGEPGSDELPEVYLIQVQHQMAVAGAMEADVAVLIGGQDFRVYEVPRNERVIEQLVRKGAEFWRQHVQARVPPAPDWAHASTPGLVEQLHRPAEGAVVSLGLDASNYADDYEDLRETARQAEVSSHLCRAKLIDRMGAAAVAWLPDGRRITRKEIARKEYVVRETTYIDFRIFAPKKGKL